MGIEQDRIIAGSARRDEEIVDRAVRPKTLADYVGQPNVKTQMDIFIQAARKRGEALDHVLIFGPPGTRQNHAGAHHRQRTEGESAPDLGAGAGACR